jgi:hypothetical protein
MFARAGELRGFGFNPSKPVDRRNFPIRNETEYQSVWQHTPLRFPALQSDRRPRAAIFGLKVFRG